MPPQQRHDASVNPPPSLAAPPALPDKPSKGSRPLREPEIKKDVAGSDAPGSGERDANQELAAGNLGHGRCRHAGRFGAGLCGCADGDAGWGAEHHHRGLCVFAGARRRHRQCPAEQQFRAGPGLLERHRGAHPGARPGRRDRDQVRRDDRVRGRHQPLGQQRRDLGLPVGRVRRDPDGRRGRRARQQRGRRSDAGGGYRRYRRHGDRHHRHAGDQAAEHRRRDQDPLLQPVVRRPAGRGQLPRPTRTRSTAAPATATRWRPRAAAAVPATRPRTSSKAG